MTETKSLGLPSFSQSDCPLITKSRKCRSDLDAPPPYSTPMLVEGTSFKRAPMTFLTLAKVYQPFSTPGKQRSRPQVAQVVTFSWASRREAANHEEQKQETETGSAENQARPSGSGSCQSRRPC